MKRSEALIGSTQKPTITEAEYRERMNNVFDRQWAFQYDEADWFKHGISQAEKYGLTRIA